MVRKYGKYLAGVITLILLTSFSASADVSVYAEGAYTDSDLVVYIYADVDETDPIVSYGVKLGYNASMLGLNTATGLPDLTESGDVDTDGVIKNYEDWYFGDASPGYDTPNANPMTATAGEVVIVGGKIKTSAPTEGVDGTRVLLARVFFTHAEVDPDDLTFVITLSKGKDGDYANFVQVDSTELDDTAGLDFSTVPVIRERGDANGDKAVDFQDMLAIKFYTQNGGIFHCYSDCNNDGALDFQDMLCIKAKTQ